MRINELLEARVKPYEKITVDADKVVDFLAANCSQAVKSMGKTPLARYSSRGYGEISIIDPTVGERKSQNTSNQYTLLMDNSPYMQGWPKRSKSLICYSQVDSWNVGSDYYYYLYPFDDTMIGICEQSDLWDTETSVPSLGLRNRSWESISETLEHYLSVPDTSYQDMVNYVNSEKFAGVYADFTNKVKDFRAGSSINTAYFKPLDDPSKLIEALQYDMRPEENGMSLVSVDDWTGPLTPKRECWFSNKCVAIQAKYFVNVLTDNPKFLSMIYEN